MEPESELSSLVTEIISLDSTKYFDSEFEPESGLLSLLDRIFSVEPEPELISLIRQLMTLVISMNLNSEAKLISLISRLVSLLPSMELSQESEFITLITQIIYLVSSMDLDSLPKPESHLIFLITQVISLYGSISDLEPESELVSLITRMMHHVSDSEFISLINQLFSLEPEPELVSSLKQIMSLVRSMFPEPEKFIFLCPQDVVELDEGRFYPERYSPVRRWRDEREECDHRNMEFYRITTDDYTVHFRCPSCNGEGRDEYYKAPLQVKHPLQTLHSLQLVLLKSNSRTRRCYCCDEDLKEIFYHCFDCDCAMNIACVEKPPPVVADHPKWHEHMLVLFPRQTSLICNVCALTHSSCPFYMCPPCNFVIHQRCISLPRVIRISRHSHCLRFTSSYDAHNYWSCGVCHGSINPDYGGYSCIKHGCSFAAHSMCATQSNVWDGKEFEENQEEIVEEEVEPFIKITDVIIHHFSHEHHLSRCDEDMSGDYDENKKCQACTTPIYYGNFYSCMECDFIIHERCANLSHKIHHPVHAHQLTLVAKHDVRNQVMIPCSLCLSLCDGFFYKCDIGGCSFKVHVQCAVISEPLVHESHCHPLFLTSIPGERRICYVCDDICIASTKAYREAFNCIQCNFSLCYKCVVLPQKVRYRHDKHLLTLSYGRETSNKAYWCEVCEGEINSRERFYMCDEYCCLTVHVQCLIGEDSKMKPGLLLIYSTLLETVVRPNDHRSSRPICYGCYCRCLFKTYLECLQSPDPYPYYCSVPCLLRRFRLLSLIY